MNELAGKRHTAEENKALRLMVHQLRKQVGPSMNICVSRYPNRDRVHAVTSPSNNSTKAAASFSSERVDVRLAMLLLLTLLPRFGVIQSLHQLGALYCKVNDIGPTGGFCLQSNTNAASVGGNDSMDQGVCTELSKLLANSSVVDFG